MPLGCALFKRRLIDLLQAQAHLIQREGPKLASVVQQYLALFDKIYRELHLLQYHLALPNEDLHQFSDETLVAVELVQTL